jgi:dienelactone hydrolase
MKSIPAIFLTMCAAIAASFSPSVTAAEISTKTVPYKDGTTAMEGYLALPASGQPAPGVLIVHDWTGVQEYARMRADMLAKLGYAAFCCDIYGKGVRPVAPKDCGAEATKYKGDRALFRQRLLAGLAAFRAQDGVDKANISAIGYCFGGTGVLELARAGADVRGVVSFHGGLDSPVPSDGKKIKARVLILHGADDPYVPEKDIKACLDEFNKAGVDWQMISYSGAVHSFTKAETGNDKSTGAAYDAKADKRSWEAMKTFLAEVAAK